MDTVWKLDAGDDCLRAVGFNPYMNGYGLEGDYRYGRIKRGGFNPYMNGYGLEAIFQNFTHNEKSFNPYMNGYGLEDYISVGFRTVHHRFNPYMNGYGLEVTTGWSLPPGRPFQSLYEWIRSGRGLAL